MYQVSHDHESFLRFKTWFFDDALRLIFNQCLSWLGMDGEACLLRAVCEVGAAPEHEDGLMGDAVTTLLTATNTYTSITNPSQHANQYAEAQLTGQVQYINLTRRIHLVYQPGQDRYSTLVLLEGFIWCINPDKCTVQLSLQLSKSWTGTAIEPEFSVKTRFTH